MTAPSSALEEAFAMAASELGMCSAAWLFVRETAVDGQDGVRQLRDGLGRSFPVLDAVAGAFLTGCSAPAVDVRPVLSALRGTDKLVVVGLESLFLDALLAELPGVQVGLLTHGHLPADWERVLGNLGPQVRGLGFGDFQSFAGPRSALLTFAYGRTGHNTHVAPVWARIEGDDVRPQFRELIGWDVLRAPIYVYPRWLVEWPVASFTHFCAP